MKKVGFVIIVVVMMVLPVMVFAGGRGEEAINTGFPDNIVVTNSGFNDIAVRYDHRGGSFGMLVDIENFNVDIGFIKTSDIDGNIIYKNIYTGEILPTSIYNDLYDIFPTGTVPLNLAVGFVEEYPNLSNIRGATGTYTPSIGAEVKALLVKPSGIEAEENSQNINGDVYVSYFLYNRTMDYDILLIDKNGKYNRFQFDLFQEFFVGEGNLFGQVSGNYEQKALALMGKILDVINML